MTNTEKERKKYPTKFDPNNECPHGLISHKLCEICNNVRPVEDELFSTQQQLQETQAKLEEATRVAAAYEAMLPQEVMVETEFGLRKVKISTEHLDALLQAARQDEREKAILESRDAVIMLTIPNDPRVCVPGGEYYSEAISAITGLLSAAPKEAHVART